MAFRYCTKVPTIGDNVKYYRYMIFERGNEVLKTGHFCLSSIGCFNVPFDGYGIANWRMMDKVNIS